MPKPYPEEFRRDVVTMVAREGRAPLKPIAKDFGISEGPPAVRWCREAAGTRIHGTTRLRPAEVFAAKESIQS